MIWKIKRKIHKLLIKWSFNPRPSSIPYISGDTFRSFADKIHEKGNFLNPLLVNEKDIVFIESEILLQFLNEIHPQIKNNYILITHNGDTNINDEFVKYVDDKIIHWFAQNVLIQHSKITPIPIGLENAYYHNNGTINIFNKLIKNKANNISKKNRILFGFNILTNEKERRPAFNSLSKNKLAERLENWPNPKKYLQTVQKYKFIASPAGNGNDCHRTWESLLLKTIPIVQRSVGNEYFKSIGLPIYIIDSWDDLLKFSENELDDIYNKAIASFKDEAMYFDFWHKKIISKRQ